MGKRRHEACKEKLRRKIKKLTRRLENRTSSTSEESVYSNSSPVENTSQPTSPTHELQSTLPPPDSGSTFLQPLEDSGPTLPPTDSQVTPENQVTVPVEVDLDEDILNILGEAPKEDIPLGPAIHKDIANRWHEILFKGLTKEIRNNLVKDYIIPKNCNMLLAPMLNPEVKAALPEALSKRDSSLMFKQKQLGIALSALASATEMIINNETSKQKILKPLSDACRLLCYKHYEETCTRRAFVISSINTNMKEALIDAKRDTFLFGENLNEKLKAAKNIQRSGETLKNTQKIAHKINFSSKVNKGNLNFKPLHRKTDNKFVGELQRVIRPGARQQTAAVPRLPAYKPVERPAPPRQNRRR